MNLILRSKMIRAVEQVLHAPGNYQGGILEMAVVFDMALPTEQLQTIGADLAKQLKSHSEVFRNVRLNAICWSNDERPGSELFALPVMMMGRFPTDEAELKLQSDEKPETEKPEAAEAQGIISKQGRSKKLANLLDYLKRFQARSKLIFLITNGDFIIEETAVKEAMKPFLEKKLIVLSTKAYAGEFVFRYLLEYKEEFG